MVTMPAVPAAPGVRLEDRYRLDAPIAAGGMGEVWRATDLVLDRQVAVKMLRPGYAGQEEDLARFRAEARHAGLLSHPGIAKVYDYRDGEPPYLVMELVDGPSLARLLDDGPVAPALTMSLIAQAARALQAAHAPHDAAECARVGGRTRQFRARVEHAQIGGQQAVREPR